ncbi:MAG: CHAT domain-containing protein [Calditrichaeota bacterium]|nr:CHAT domain-containing protein [Calditrichota bacterium]
MGEKWGRCVNLSNLAYLSSLDKNRQKALQDWDTALNLSEELGEIRLQAWLRLQLGDFYLKQDELDESAKNYEEGLAILEEFNDPELRWQLYYGQGQLWQERGDEERAYFSFRAAIATIEEIRGSARVQELKAGVVHERYQVYESMITLLLEMGREEDAFQYVERARARNLLDLLGNGKISSQVEKTRQQIEREHMLRCRILQLFKQISRESEGHYGRIRGTALDTYQKSLQEAQDEYQRLLLDLELRNPEYASMIRVDPLNSAELKQIIPENAVLLEYMMTGTNTIIFALTRENLQVLVNPHGRDFIRGRITLFLGTAVRYMDEKKLTEEHWKVPLRELYDVLILPVEIAGLLAGKSHLIIVPQGILHNLPFQVLLITGENREEIDRRQRFLVEDYTISYSPSASLLSFCKDKNRGKKDNLLLMAPHVRQLPMSEKEVTDIAASFGSGAECFLNSNATEEFVKNHGGKYRLLHFATTAYFNRSNPLFSRLALAEGGADDGNLEVHEIFGLDLNAYLVGLSACETALGSGHTVTIPRGDDLVSLSRAFIYAGTPSVVASLWEVADVSTAVLMARFYENLKQMNKAEALAAAQREMISGAVVQQNYEKLNYSHPYFWAPFIVLGDWE